jgi:hypothetical protein
VVVVFYSCDISAELVNLLLRDRNKILFVASIIVVSEKHVKVYVEIFLSACQLVGWICFTQIFRRSQRRGSCVVVTRNDSFNLSTAEMLTRSLIVLITRGCKKESNYQVNSYPKCEIL